MEARLTDDRTPQLGVASCHGEPEVTQLLEEEAAVRVEVTATVSDPGDACMDLIEVELRAPLGARDVVDLTSGTTLPVGP
jgi:hypothetical protein